MLKLKYFAISFACSLASISFIVKAASFDPNDAHFLVKSCKETMEMYKSKSIPTTTPTEALLAGYCIGTVQQYLKFSKKEGTTCIDPKTNITSPLLNNTWYDMAQYIANTYSYNIGESTTVSSILGHAICNKW